MNKKNCLSAMGEITPLISNQNGFLFIDSDISGENDENRNAILLTKKDSKFSNYIVKITGFDYFDGNSITGNIYLSDEDGIENLIAQPVYRVNRKFKLSNEDIKSYILDIWVQAINEYKSINTIGRLGTDLAYDKDTNFSKLSVFFPKRNKIFIYSGLICLLSLAVAMPFSALFDGEQEKVTNQITTQSINGLTGVDGKTLALQNLGLDPNSMEFDNSCFTEN